MARDERFSPSTQAALIDVVVDLYTHDALDQLFRRLDVKEEDDRKGGRSRTKPRRAGDAVDALIRRGPTHGSDVLELCRIVLEVQLNGRVTVSVVT